MKVKKKIVLAMSGGVDSSVAALLLLKRGYEVHGFFMNCFNEKKYWPSGINWSREEKDVRAICKKLGIKDLFVLNCEEGYADAVAYYITQGCWVRDNRPKQYEWLRNNVFDGKEFCNK